MSHDFTNKHAKRFFNMVSKSVSSDDLKKITKEIMQLSKYSKNKKIGCREVLTSIRLHDAKLANVLYSEFIKSI